MDLSRPLYWAPVLAILAAVCSQPAHVQFLLSSRAHLASSLCCDLQRCLAAPHGSTQDAWPCLHRLRCLKLGPQLVVLFWKAVKPYEMEPQRRKWITRGGPPSTSSLYFASWMWMQCGQPAGAPGTTPSLLAVTSPLPWPHRGRLCPLGTLSQTKLFLPFGCSYQSVLL